MSFLLNISVRNLFRQKRRNLFLGIGIAFGVAVLVIATSFSTGLTDILLNKIVSNSSFAVELKCRYIKDL